VANPPIIGKNTWKEFEMKEEYAMDAIKIGDKAPTFTLEATTKEKISLSDYLGNKNVVVAFYGMDFTPG